jgi:hypothetical protein
VRKNPKRPREEQRRPGKKSAPELPSYQSAVKEVCRLFGLRPPHAATLQGWLKATKARRHLFNMRK